MAAAKAPKAVYFPSPDAWRDWLAANHDTATELVVGYYKVGTGKPSLTWPQSVDEALCFGWIDGVRHRVDDARYTIRFTPRRNTSVWSAVNVRRVGELEKEGRMQAAGRKAFNPQRQYRSGNYSYEARPEWFDEPYATRFRKAKRAWAFFEQQPPSYRRVAIWYVVSAKREETREKRLARLIEDSASGRRIGQLEPPPSKRAKG